MIRSSETIVLPNPDVVNEFYEHSTWLKSINATWHYLFGMSSYDFEHTRTESWTDSYEIYETFEIRKIREIHLWNLVKYVKTFDGQDICFFPSLKYSLCILAATK